MNSIKQKQLIKNLKTLGKGELARRLIATTELNMKIKDELTKWSDMAIVFAGKYKMTCPNDPLFNDLHENTLEKINDFITIQKESEEAINE